MESGGNLQELGFVNEPVGTHACRSLTVDEVRKLFAATKPSASYEEIRRLILDENALVKPTWPSRHTSVRRLREFYGLSPDLPVYSALRFFWDRDVKEQPVLALLCASARDPVLRESAGLVLHWPVGTALPKQRLEEFLTAAYPGRHSPSAVASITRKLLSSWTQSGHLCGRTVKTRTRALSGPASTAYALFLAFLMGACGDALFDTFWVRVLDVPLAEVHRHAFEASKRGWIDYKAAGGIVDVSFDAVPGANRVRQGEGRGGAYRKSNRF